MTEPDATAPCAALRDPSRFVERWTSRDGATLLIRPIVGDDEGLERAFVDGLSRDTGYRRLLSARTPQADEIARWTHIDYRKEMAVVAIDDRDATVRMCGVARYVCEGNGRAAFAIVIANDWQGHGLGRKLMEALIAAAHGRRRCIERHHAQRQRLDAGAGAAARIHDRSRARRHDPPPHHARSDGALIRGYPFPSSMTGGVQSAFWGRPGFDVGQEADAGHAEHQ